jgi:hypothetical protein
MKKVLIISYFFPPCNLTASQRIQGWANYLSSFGYYPTIVTRNWDIKINSPEDSLISSGKEITHEKNENYEVYYLPYKASARDEIYSKNKNNRLFQKVSKFFTFKDLVFENYSNSAIPFANIYNFSVDLLKKDNSFELLVISGNPFIQFKFGYLLHKKFGIKWIADYRDDWNTTELETNSKGIKKIISKIQTKSEKKWVGSAECITSVSTVYAEKIGNFVNKKGFVILNGFDGILKKENISVDKIFRITYNGSLYPTQPIEVILRVLKKIIQNYSNTIEIHFPGLGFDKYQKSRVLEVMKGCENFIFITDRIPKDEVIEIQQKSDLLLMISHEGIKGIPSSKMYEYIGLKKRILLYPNDFDIVEETLLDSQLGIICNTEKDIYYHLLNLVKAKQEGKLEEIKFDQSKIDYYSRKNQTEELARLMNQILGEE